MKIKSSNLLTVFLALLCAAAVALGIGFLLPKAEKITADAAGGSANKTTFEKIFSGCYTSSGSSPDIVYGNFTAGSSANAIVSCADGVQSLSASVEKPMSNVDGRGYVSFKAKIDVPAYTEYKITYNFSHSYQRDRTGTPTAITYSYFLYYGADDPMGSSFTDPSAGLTYWNSSSCDVTKNKSDFNTNGAPIVDSATPAVDVTYTNNNGIVKTCYAYFGFYAGGSFCGNSAYSLHLKSTLNFTSESIEVTKLNSPSSADTFTYDGTVKTFNITFDTPIGLSDAYKNVKVTTTIQALYCDGTTIASSTYSLSGVDSGGIPTSATITFTAIEAGKYTLKSNLVFAAADGGVKWDDGTANEQELTLEIKSKPLNIPDIVSTQKSQIYDAAGRTFTPNTNYDPALMDGVAVSSGITWSSNEFKATNVAEYTVKFVLKDNKNYAWSDGTTGGQETKVKITKKQLNIPEITTASPTYDGNAQTFMLNTDFDSATMKMDGVTPDDGLNVVTGPGGMGLTVTSDTFQATNAGEYTVNISLKDTNNYEWDDGTTGTKPAKFEIEKRDLVTGITCNKTVLGAPKWGLGTNGVQMTVTLDKAYNEYPALKFYYADNPANILTVASSTDTEIVVDMPTTIPVGLYNFNIALDSAADTGYNKNYKVEAPYNSIAFTVTNTESAIAYYNGDEISATINEEYDGNGKVARSDISIKGVVTDTSVTDFTLTYYKGTTATAGNELPAGNLPKDAGDYCVKITLGTAAANIYTLANDEFVVSISPKKITAPTLGSATLVFNGLTQNIKDKLVYDKDIIELVTAGSVLEGYHADTYSAYFKIKDEYKDNYIFILHESKSIVKKSLADEAEQPSYSVILSNDDKSAQLDWNIQKYVYDTTIPSAWNFTKEGASLSFKGVPASIVALTTGPSPTLIFEVLYYDQSYTALSEVTLEGGNKYYVAASLAACADRDDIIFKNQTFDNTVGRDISPHASYTVPKASGLATFFNKVKDFMTDVKFGMPVWCWFLIALAALILLIIIIVVAAKHRKSKEEKAEIKARKEEEKQRKQEEKERREEERRLQQERLEEERRLQREKLEAEREMVKAKQEAELEKIRAQAQMAGAGMATMAVAQPVQPLQQAMPAPVQQVQSVDNELLKEMRQQMAELRADNKATQAQLQAMQNSQQQQPMQMPMPQPMYPQYPYQQMPMMPQYGGDPTLARLEAQLNAMQAEQRARYDAEQRIELAAMRAESHVDRDSRHSVDLAAMREHINGYNYNRLPDYSNQQPNSIEALGAIVAAALKNMGAPALPVAELPQQTEVSSPAEVKYPSDAVITTTTTVDTTKNKPIRREEDFDVDGFYDNFE
ncbi:MAG: hypothetical protein K2N22_05875 [Clostridia bacterium]|nr:hypothetical protein [Clostridia bacterium]